jgi:ABC-type transporter Mla maintaining outer membrane lipid asymmetry permease subunit MlaE
MALFAAKTVLPGMITGAVCCIYGLRVEPVLTGVPQAATRSAVASVWGVILAMAACTALAVL